MHAKKERERERGEEEGGREEDWTNNIALYCDPLITRRGQSSRRPSTLSKG